MKGNLLSNYDENQAENTIYNQSNQKIRMQIEKRIFNSYDHSNNINNSSMLYNSFDKSKIISKETFNSPKKPLENVRSLDNFSNEYSQETNKLEITGFESKFIFKIIEDCNQICNVDKYYYHKEANWTIITFKTKQEASIVKDKLQNNRFYLFKNIKVKYSNQNIIEDDNYTSYGNIQDSNIISIPRKSYFDRLISYIIS